MENIKDLQAQIKEIRSELENDSTMKTQKRIELNYKLYTLNNLIRILKEI